MTIAARFSQEMHPALAGAFIIFLIFGAITAMFWSYIDAKWRTMLVVLIFALAGFNAFIFHLLTQ